VSEVLFVTDYSLWEEEDDPYGWTIKTLHQEMLDRATKEGWSLYVFDYLIVMPGEFLADALLRKSGATARIMEIQLHGFREDDISYLMTNWDDMRNCTHVDFCIAVIESGITAGKIILRVCGVKASDYNNYDYDGRSIHVEIGAQGFEHTSLPILNPSDKYSTGAKIWQYYGRKYFPNHMEVEDLILGPVR